MTNTDIKIVEMGARDGLQSERLPVSLKTKITLIDQLAGCGLIHIEAGSFVRPDRVPQMADTPAVFEGITRKAGVIYSALTPNLKGFEQAVSAGADEVAIFASASEGFSRKNLNCDIATSLIRFAEVTRAAQQAGIPVRGYVSCIAGCPYDGDVSHASVIDVTEKLFDMGCVEVSLGDTIGTGTPGRIRQLLKALLQSIPPHKIAMHMHDTYGQAIANIYVSLEEGIRTFDASVGGIGGCPYAKGATGNVATEDLVYLLDREGFNHGIALLKLSETGLWINKALQRQTTSRAGLAMLNRQNAQ